MVFRTSWRYLPGAYDLKLRRKCADEPGPDEPGSSPSRSSDLEPAEVPGRSGTS